MGLIDIKRSLANLIKIGQVSQVKDDLLQTMRIDINAIDASDDVARWQQLGFASKPVEADAALVLSVAGHRFVVAVDDLENRPKALKGGEVMMWHRQGHHVHLKDGQVINAKCKRMVIDAEDEYVVNTKKAVTNASTRAVINTPMTRVSDVLNVGGAAVFASTITSGPLTAAAITANGGISGLAAATFGSLSANSATIASLTVNGKDVGNHKHIAPASGGQTGGMV